MKRLLLAAVVLVQSFCGFSQNTMSDLGCATITTETEMQNLAAYLSSNVSMKTTGVNDTLPLSIHIVGKNDGTGYYNLENLFNVICQLNTRFAAVGFYFYIKGPIKYINNSGFYEHNYSGGYQMMSQNNIFNTINVYFVGDPSGACGYYSYGPDAVAIKNSCASTNSTTLTHELGHYFGLPHTFYGWENGNIPSTPEKVTRGPSANCSTAGDMFCDTDADFLNYRWQCPYTGNMLDVAGEAYHPDSSLYMAYAVDACNSRFSNQQIGSIHYNKNFYRSNLVQSHPVYSELSVPEVVFPTSFVYANDKTIRWKKVPGADYYHVKVSFHPSGFTKQEAFVADTSLLLNFVLSDLANYIVKVTPISGMNTCRKKTGSQEFKYSNTLSVSSLEAGNTGISIAPNPASQQVVVSVTGIDRGTYQLEVISITGQRMYRQSVTNTAGSFNITVPLSGLANGLYMVKLSGDNVIRTEKLIIQH